MKRALVAVGLSLAACGGGGGGSDEVPAAEVAVRAVKVADAAFATSLAFLPDGRMVYGELSTGLVRTVRDGAVEPTPVVRLRVSHEPGEGILDVLPAEDFTSSRALYVFYISQSPRGGRLSRITVPVSAPAREDVLLDGFPAGGHNGGKLLQRGGELFISTGDAGDPANAQSTESRAGKILLYDLESGAVATFASGVRNVFGLAISNANGELYAADNGPACSDEVNLVERGVNLGWRPDQPCDDSDPRFRQPLTRITPSVGVTGLVYWNGGSLPEYTGELFVADFNSGSIRRLALSDDGTRTIGEGFVIRGSGDGIVALAESPDGALYYSTQNAIYRVER